MTVSQWIEMIGEAETGGFADERARCCARGDNGLAGGYYQMHWDWRRDYWPAIYWDVLRVLDRDALRLFVKAHPHLTARQLADMFNLGHNAPDPAYDKRCAAGLHKLKIDPAELDAAVVAD